MLETIVVGLAWAAAVLILGLVGIKTIQKYLSDRLELDRQKQTTRELDQAVARQERQNAANLAAGTMEQTVALNNAELALKAVEATTAAEVARGTVQERIDEEKRIIAARAEGAALAAQDMALSAATRESDLAILTASYKTYLENGGRENFGDWLGSIDLKFKDGVMTLKY